MRVLFIAGACPYPPDSGGTVRTFNLLKHLWGRHEITLIAPANPGVDLDAVFGRRLKQVITVPGPRRSISHTLSSFIASTPYIVRAHENPAMNAAVTRALADERYDLLHCDSISVVPSVPASASLPKVFNAHNVEAMIWERYVREERRPWMRPMLESQLAKVAAYESHLPQRFDSCVTVSEDDRVQMQQRYGFENVGVVENGVDLGFYMPVRDPDTPTMAFIGSLDWRPNQDAIRWFLESIWPSVRARIRDVGMLVIGRRPPPWMKNLCERAGVTLRADVPDVRPHLADAAVVVVPLRIGGGSRLKILEAMAAGRCVVSTSIGAEGLDVRNSEHLVIADEPEVFARECVFLLKDRSRRQAFARAGRALVEANYGWDQAAVQMEEAWTHACSPLPSRG